MLPVRSGWVLDGLALTAAAAATVEGIHLGVRDGDGPVLIAANAGVTVSYVLAGVLARHRPGREGLALPMVAAGLSWGLPDLLAAVHAPQWLVFSSVFLIDVFVIFLLLTYPAGRVRGRVERWTVRGSVVVFIVFHTLLYPLHGTRLFDLLVVLESALQDTLYVAVAVLLVTRWRRSSRAVRRALTPLWVAGVLAAISVVPLASLRPWTNLAVEHRLNASASAALLRGFFDAENAATLIELLIPLCFLLGLARSSGARAAVADLVLDLESGAEPGLVRDAVARALGDPSLQIYYWLPDVGHETARGRGDVDSGADRRGADGGADSGGADSGGADRGVGGRFVAADGTPARLDRLTAAQALTEVVGANGPLAALVYDRELQAQPTLLRSVVAAARLALDNAGLQAQLNAQLVQMSQSRTRIVEAGLAERRRVERDLHDGAQQRLLALGLTVSMMRDRLSDTATEDPQLARLVEEADAEVHASITELRELARGIHPAVLTTHGLSAAVTGLTARFPLPVTIDIPAQRWNPLTEAAAYFLISEALANITKHAHAESVAVLVRSTTDRLQVSVCDDGIGGVPTAATGGAPLAGGLPGLADRVVALGGTFEVISPPGQGTTVTGEFACG